MLQFQRALIVEDDAALCRAMARVAHEVAAEVLETGTHAEGLELLDAAPDLILLDVGLPDGSGVKLAEEAVQRRPTPLVVVVSGAASQKEAYELGALGVRGYLAKPFGVYELRREIEQAAGRRPPLEPFITAQVGDSSLPDVVHAVRETMVEEALAQSGGSRRGAASRLGVSRQAVQQLVRKSDRLATRAGHPSSASGEPGPGDDETPEDSGSSGAG